MNARAIAGVTGGILLAASSAAHAFVGWPTLRGALTGTGAVAWSGSGLARGAA